MKTFLIILGCVIILSTFIIIRRWVRKGKICIGTILTCKGLYINPDLGEKYIYPRKGGYIKVREGLEMMKISEETLMKNNVRFFESFNPDQPDKRLLVLVEVIDLYEYNRIQFGAGSRVAYIENGQVYIAAASGDFDLEKYGPPRIFRTTTEDTSIKFSQVLGCVKKIYGDYEIKESNS